MYHSFFGLRHAPFPDAIRPGGYYEGAPFGSLIDTLIAALGRGDNVLKFIGTAGSGKTTVCHALQERIRERQHAFYVSAAGQGDVLRAVARALGVEVSDGASGFSAIPGIIQRLAALHRDGAKGVLILDDCHEVRPETLEQIRMICDQNRQHNPSLQLVLCARPEFDRMLAQDNLRALRSRIVHHLGLPSLTPAAVQGYLISHLRRAGYFGPDLFSPGVAKAIARASGGLPRAVNAIADRTLLAAFCCNTHTLHRHHVRMAAQGELRHRRLILGRLHPAR